MADLPADFIITANGTYEFPAAASNPGLNPQVQYLLQFKPIGGATIVVAFNSGPANAFVAADNGTFSSAKTEDRFIPGGSRMQMVVTGWTVPIKFTCNQAP